MPSAVLHTFAVGVRKGPAVLPQACTGRRPRPVFRATFMYSPVRYGRNRRNRFSISWDLSAPPCQKVAEQNNLLNAEFSGLRCRALRSTVIGPEEPFLLRLRSHVVAFLTGTRKPPVEADVLPPSCVLLPRTSDPAERSQQARGRRLVGRQLFQAFPPPSHLTHGCVPKAFLVSPQESMRPKNKARFNDMRSLSTFNIRHDWLEGKEKI